MKPRHFDGVSGRTEGNIIEAAASGAANAIALVANIAVNLIAFIAILYFINATLTWFGQRVGIEELTYQVIVGCHMSLKGGPVGI